jgi:hypothetical protein
METFIKQIRNKSFFTFSSLALKLWTKTTLQRRLALMGISNLVNNLV